MDATLKRLIALLKQECDLYRSLLGLIDQEKDAAAQADVDALNETGVEKEIILLEIQKAEAKRSELLAELAPKLGLPAENLTLSAITRRAEEPLAGNLRDVSQIFLSVLSRVQSANQRNKKIFEHSLELLRGSFNWLHELTSPNTVYFSSGNIRGAKSTGKCVRSEV